MNRKLVLLNVVLAAVIVFAGVKWRERIPGGKGARSGAAHGQDQACFRTAVSIRCPTIRR